MVTEGVKTVELCPPGCIEARPIYSEHANHPAVFNQPCTSKNSLCQSTQDILKLKDKRTHLVSISAGQALYIPSGWWHRVESNGICTAVNVWFDYDASEAEVPKHMAPFRCRQQKRTYYEKHETDLAASYLEKLRHARPVLYAATPVNSKHDTMLARNLNSLKELVMGKELLDDESVVTFLQLFSKCWEENNLREAAYIHYFADVMNAFFLRVRMDHPQQMQELVRLWPKLLTIQQTELKATTFKCLIENLTPSSFYVITQAWERHASEGKPEEGGLNCEDEVESSYKTFFQIFSNEYIEQQIRAILVDGVNVFKEAMCQNKLP
jgi:hypothetical protein